jgi:hypothetical protein
MIRALLVGDDEQEVRSFGYFPVVPGRDEN